MIKTIIDFLFSLFNKQEQEQKSEELVYKYKEIDVINDLPRHKTRTWNNRPLSKIDEIIVHQALSIATLEQIAKYHSTPSPNNHLDKEGAPGFAYHYAIDNEGTVYKTNELNKLTWHCAKHNTRSIGIVILGDFGGPSHEGKNNVTDKQEAVLMFLLEKLMREFPKAEIMGHKDAAKTKENCPGYEISEILRGV